MDRQHMVWPVTGSGAQLATRLRDAATAGGNRLSGTGDEVIVGYLEWVSHQVRSLQGLVGPGDLDRLLTSRRYWATLDNPIATSTTVQSVLTEIEHRIARMRSVADAVDAEVTRWHPSTKNTDFVVADTNVWLNIDGSLSAVDWRGLVDDNEGDSYSSGEELRIVLPMLVVDELDNLGHRGDLRPKVNGVTRYLYGLLGSDPTTAGVVRAKRDGTADVTIRLLFDPVGHERLANSDDELIDRTVVLRAFLGIPSARMFFLTHDAGAAFRATNAGLMTRLLKTPARK